MKGIGMGSRDAAEALLDAEVIECLEAPGANPRPATTSSERVAGRLPMDRQESRDER